MSTATAAEIIASKNEAGTEAYLWLHTTGDCILWPSEEASEGDDGRSAIARWTTDEVDALIDSGEVDCVA